MHSTSTPQTFPDEFKALRADKGVSLRQLEKLLTAAGSPLSNAYLSQINTGRTRATVANMEAIAGALDEDPTYFAGVRREYAARAASDLSDQVGYEKVMGKLKRLAARKGVTLDQ